MVGTSLLPARLLVPRLIHFWVENELLSAVRLVGEGLFVHGGIDEWKNLLPAPLSFQCVDRGLDLWETPVERGFRILPEQEGDVLVLHRRDMKVAIVGS